MSPPYEHWATPVARLLLTQLGETVLSHPFMDNCYSFPQEAVPEVAKQITELDAALTNHPPYTREKFWTPHIMQQICENEDGTQPGYIPNDDQARDAFFTLQDELEAVAHWMRDNEGKYAGKPALPIP